MTDTSSNDKGPDDASELSEQTAGAGGNNPARPSETGGNSIEIGDTIQDVVEMDPNNGT